MKKQILLCQHYYFCQSIWLRVSHIQLMNQQSLLSPPDLNPQQQNQESPQMIALQKQVKALQVKFNLLKGFQKRQRQLNDQIDKLQQQSQQHYSTLRKLTLQYKQQYTIFSSKIDNRSQDICDEKDRIESNIYYLKEQNQRLEGLCKQKLQEKTRFMHDIEIYHNKKEKLSLDLSQENIKIAQQIRKNRAIQQTQQSVRRQNQIYQQEIFQANLRGQNYKKYGYQVIPDRIQYLLNTKERIETDLKELQQRQQRHRRSVNKFVKLQLLQKAKEKLAQQKQKNIMLNQLQRQNIALREEKDRLYKIKNSFEQNPNLQLQQLQRSLSQQQKKINNIESDLSVLKRKSVQISQKIKQYTNYLRMQAENDIVYQENDTHKDSKQKVNRKQKYKHRHNATIFEQIKNDLQLRDPSKKFNWKQMFTFEKSVKDESKVININEYTYKVIKSSQIIHIIVIFLILSVLTYYCTKSFKK